MNMTMNEAIRPLEAETYSEIEYVYTGWKQGYQDSYPNFEDYLKVAISGKEITGTIYQ